jgi:hypothetical protein
MRHIIKTCFWLSLACLALVGCDGNNRNDGNGSTNQPPVISGSPSAPATVGQRWSFQPSISDPDGDPLTVTANNLPAWITLTPSTGRLEGTPSEGDVRTWENITLTVTDGMASAELPRFSVTVQAAGAANGSATLRWIAPTENVDGSPIGQLVGYRVLYGQVSRNYDHVVELNNPGITTYVVQGLGAGTWYFALQAVTSDGEMSAPSAEASKRI